MMYRTGISLFTMAVALQIAAAPVPLTEARAEALVVLEYPGFSDDGSGMGSSDNPFVRNPNHKAVHKIGQDETLSEILSQYYGGSGLNMKFVQLAVVSMNRSAFVRGNPNYMFAGKRLHLPSLHEMDKLLRGQSTSGADAPQEDKRDEIYFIGG